MSLSNPPAVSIVEPCPPFFWVACSSTLEHVLYCFEICDFVNLILFRISDLVLRISSSSSTHTPIHSYTNFYYSGRLIGLSAAIRLVGWHAQVLLGMAFSRLLSILKSEIDYALPSTTSAASFVARAPLAIYRLYILPCPSLFP